MGGFNLPSCGGAEPPVPFPAVPGQGDLPGRWAARGGQGSTRGGQGSTQAARGGQGRTCATWPICEGVTVTGAGNSRLCQYHPERGGSLGVCGVCVWTGTRCCPLSPSPATCAPLQPSPPPQALLFRPAAPRPPSRGRRAGAGVPAHVWRLHLANGPGEPPATCRSGQSENRSLGRAANQRAVAR